MPSDALRDTPLPFVVAERVATGVPPAIPVTANCAEEVAPLQINRS